MSFTLFLVGSAMFGVGLIRRLFGRLLGHAEQALWRLVVGWMLTTCAVYLLARLAGQLSFAANAAAPLAGELAALAPREFAARLDEDPHQFLVEFPRAAYSVYRYYKVAYGRGPTLDEMMTGLKAVGREVYVSAPGWRETLEANKGALTNSLAGSQSFKSLHDARANGEYVDALYVNAGVRPPDSERAALVALLDGGTEDRASILRRIAENRELYRRDYNRAYVLAHFFGYLRNDPTAAGQDLKEFNSRLDTLNRTRDYRGLTHDFIRLAEHLSR